MGKITFILGGARSGKSRFARELVKNKAKKVAFVATCMPLDTEMKKRIALHKKARPAAWRIFEKPEDIPSLLEKVGSRFEVIIIDCLTLLISEFMFCGLKENGIEDKINAMLKVLTKIKAEAIVVSNEVGLGVVPKNKLARNFRDIAGRMNQLVASKADKVYFLISGLPWRIK